MVTDTQTVADALAYCEAHCDAAELAVLEWVAEHVADAILRQHPRFDRHGFLTLALPTTARLHGVS